MWSIMVSWMYLRFSPLLNSITLYKFYIILYCFPIFIFHILIFFDFKFQCAIRSTRWRTRASLPSPRPLDPWQHDAWWYQSIQNLWTVLSLFTYIFCMWQLIDWMALSSTHSTSRANTAETRDTARESSMTRDSPVSNYIMDLIRLL